MPATLTSKFLPKNPINMSQVQSLLLALEFSIPAKKFGLHMGILPRINEGTINM